MAAPSIISVKLPVKITQFFLQAILSPIRAICLPFTVEKGDPLTTVPPQEVLSPTHMLPRIKNMSPSPKKLLALSEKIS